MENINVKKALDLIHGASLKEKYGTYSKLYAFTTENIGGYYSKIEFKNKRVLTVCGSGDHILNAILLGSKYIDAFDINVFTYYLLKLKIAAIKTLSYFEFLDYFLLEENDKAMDYKLFGKIKVELESDVLKFWETLYKDVKYEETILRNSALFHNTYDTNEKKLMSNLYLDMKNFGLLKENMRDIKINFIESSLLQLKERCEKNYDLIFLSNISDYLSFMFHDKLLENYRRQIVIPLKQKLNKNGKLYFIYQYDIGNERSVVDNMQEVERVFLNVQELTFASVIDANKKDRILYIGE